jgi:hypothetical protein
MSDQDTLAGTCAVCGAERPMEALAIEMVNGGLVWICGGIDPGTGEDAITDCETRRGI